MNPDKDNSLQTVLIAIPVIAVLVFAISLFLQPPEPLPVIKPIKLPTTEAVGEFTGKKSKEFGKGFLKGLFK